MIILMCAYLSPPNQFFLPQVFSLLSVANVGTNEERKQDKGRSFFSPRYPQKLNFPLYSWLPVLWSEFVDDALPPMASPR
jgi:hypothetical protein